MISKKERFLIKDNIYRSVQIKHTYKTLLRRSLIKNNLLNKSKKIYLNIGGFSTPTLIRRRNLCLLTGENHGVRKNLLLSRFQINTQSTKNQLQNFSINS